MVYSLARQNEPDLVLFEDSHVFACLGGRDFHSVLGEYPLECSNRRHTAVVDRGSSPIQDDCSEMFEVHKCSDACTAPLFQRSVSSPPAITEQTTKKLNNWSQPNQPTMEATA